MAASDYSDLDDEIRPHLANYVREVIRRGHSFYPELETDFWPRSLAYWRHREAFYVGMVLLYAPPGAGERWGLTAEEVDEYRRVRNDTNFTRFDDALDDLSISCGGGWIDLLRRMMAEISAADIKVFGLVADEDQGRLRIDYTSAEPWLAAAKVFLLAEFRSYYVCETCGRPGEHRINEVGWKHTRCTEHRSLPPNDGDVIYTEKRTPWRRMSDGDWAYDPICDRLERMTERLSDRYEDLFHLTPVIILDPDAEAIVDHALRRIADTPLAADYRIGGIRRDERGYLVVEDNLYDLPDIPARDLVMAFWASADDRISKLSVPEDDK